MFWGQRWCSREGDGRALRWGQPLRGGRKLFNMAIFCIKIYKFI
jgi:hypothetical protein